MDENRAAKWIRKYQIELARNRIREIPGYKTDMEIPEESQLVTDEDFRNVGDAYLFFGEVFIAENVYNIIGESIPAEKLLEAGERMRNKMALRNALRCYQLAVDNIGSDEVERMRTGLKYLRDRHVLAKASTDKVDVLIRLVQKVK